MGTSPRPLDLAAIGDLLDHDTGAREALATTVLEWFLDRQSHLGPEPAAAPGEPATAESEQLPAAAASAMNEAIATLAALLDEHDQVQARQCSQRARAHQAQRALARPLPEDGAIDPIAIERVVHGERVRLTPAEREVAALELAQRGYSDRVIAARVGISDRTVLRWRHQAGIPAGGGALRAVKSA